MGIAIFKHHSGIVSLPILLILGGFFFASTNPRTASPLTLILGFMIIFAIVHVALRLLVGLLWSKTSPEGLKVKSTRRVEPLVTWGGAGLVVVFLAMQSIGQLTTRDVITILILFVASCFYMLRSRQN